MEKIFNPNDAEFSLYLRNSLDDHGIYQIMKNTGLGKNVDIEALTENLDRAAVVIVAKNKMGDAIGTIAAYARSKDAYWITNLMTLPGRRTLSLVNALFRSIIYYTQKLGYQFGFGIPLDSKILGLYRYWGVVPLWHGEYFVSASCLGHLICQSNLSFPIKIWINEGRFRIETKGLNCQLDLDSMYFPNSAFEISLWNDFTTYCGKNVEQRT